MSFEDLRSMASILVIAGSETTATLLCGVTFLLLRNPHALKKVTDEVRGAFNSEDEITLTSVNGLTYMLACLNEALRMYPPVTSGLPRKIPAGGGIVAGMAIPENVRCLLLSAGRCMFLTRGYRQPSRSQCGRHTITGRTGRSRSSSTRSDSWVIPSLPRTRWSRSNHSPSVREIAWVGSELNTHNPKR